MANTLYEVSMGLRERVEAAAARAGFKGQSDLAAACGVKQPSVNALLSEKYPMHELLEKIARLTEVEVRWLRFGDDDARPAWAMPKDMADPLHALSASVRESRPRPRLIDLMEEILAEQRRIRGLLESFVGQDPPAQRRASIRRAADGEGSPVISTREEAER
jgi:hypothetical protein